jgi:AcrR family transcriptional regulator
MMSIRNPDASVDERILDAAAACILAFGVERTTMTEIARG